MDAIFVTIVTDKQALIQFKHKVDKYILISTLIYWF